MDCSDWSNGIPYHTFDTRPDPGFDLISFVKCHHMTWRAMYARSYPRPPPPPRLSALATRAQGLTLVHFPACCEHCFRILCVVS